MERSGLSLRLLEVYSRVASKTAGFRAEAPIPTVPPPKRHPYDQWSPDARALDLVGDKWTLLIVRDLAAGPRRFVELQRVLPGISTEQLRSRLNRMVADGLLTRQRYREVPPRVDYELTERSRELMPILAALARWGFAWTWTGPRPGEDINIGAILRLAPGLLTPASDIRGTVDFVVTGEGEGQDQTFRLTAADGRVGMTEHPQGPADAVATGSVDAWMGTLGPDGALASLEISGKRGLAEALLKGFTAAATSRAAQQAA
jgi:DNA-binding HxlR family transcriptional regulator